MRPDPGLLGLTDLLGDEAVAILRPPLAAAGGSVLRARPTQVRYEPGRRLVVRFAARVRWSDGMERTETLGALVDPRGLPAGLAVVEGDHGEQVGVWRYPYDPFLPGLARIASPPSAQALLERGGLPVGAVSIDPVVYRPATRAVLRVRGKAGTWYAKVVPPSHLASLADAHRTFARSAPVPRVMTASPELGILVLEGLPGRPLTRPLVDGGTLPPPELVLELLAGISDTPAPRHAPLELERARHAGLLQTVVPAAAERIDRLAEVATSFVPTADRTVHGDFYDRQVLCEHGRVSGLLDIDGARLGTSVDDVARFVAHLAALAHVHHGSAGRITAYRRDVQRLLARTHDRDEVQAAVVDVLLGLATTPFRRQEADWAGRTLRWLALAEEWAAAPTPDEPAI